MNHNESHEEVVYVSPNDPAIAGADIRQIALAQIRTYLDVTDLSAEVPNLGAKMENTPPWCVVPLRIDEIAELLMHANLAGYSAAVKSMMEATAR